ncbi:MAG: bifunctional phosphopantothenoylcysteine decarboxylase/phosphopantothenate--cysteine ligase CoaBC [Oscillospiraceae bacterium]|jgi:phosphopantothenoylcysteine decarboxylase/phosphopantothenate--cysteine ligase|nr:bifunctional phosphopantothenoylcysteine decarboxylase/phosphopantothenate--cysteine ligase CoaBC [Oscillospiraceae bacterium]
MLKDKTVLLGVSGSVAAYKAAALASALVKLHADVHVLMTQNALKFVNPITFETLTGNKCLTDTFDRNFQFSVEHVSLAKRADIVLLAPATANVLAKLAHGLADDMLTTTILACACGKLVSPAMNTQMLQNPVTQRNLSLLETLGFEIIQPAEGRLACGDIGAGRMPDEAVLIAYILRRIAFKKDLQGKKVLVTAGATRERLDPVRFLSNHSSGKMGYALARNCAMRGAEVTLVSGYAEVTAPLFVDFVSVTDAAEMFEAVVSRAPEQDIIIKAAAVADYTPKQYFDQKQKKRDGDLTIPLKRTADILAYLGEHRRAGQLLCGFSMETERAEDYAREKLVRKHLDMIAANNVTQENAGFAHDTNRVTIITANATKRLPLLSKAEVAAIIVDELLALAHTRA